MTDRQLLGDAARAAGMAGYRYCEAWKAMAAYTLQDGYYGPSWNPLADSGQALELAVKLRMRVTVDDDWSGAGWDAHQSAPTTDGRGPWGWKEWHYPMSGPDAGRVRDPMAATRRAIVRAAAALAPKG